MKTSTELLLPGALLPARWLGLPEIRQALAEPVLGRLAGATPDTTPSVTDGRALPHEHRLADALGLPGPDALLALGHPDLPPEARWLVQPAHLQVGMDRVTLAALLATELSAQESAALLEAAAPTLAEAGWAMGTAAGCWWLATPDEPELSLTTPLAALGRGVETLLPRGADARRWRRIGTEIEMAWFDHPVNRARQDSGRPVVNGLWLAGRVAAPTPAVTLRVPPGHALAEVATDPARPLMVLDDRLLMARLDQDPGSWARLLPAVLHQSVAPLLAQLDAGRIERIELRLTGDQALRRATLSRPGWSDRLRSVFGSRPDPAALLGEPSDPEPERPDAPAEPDPFDLSLPGPSWRGGRR